MTEPGPEIVDEEDGTLSCCTVPSLSHLRKPIEVGSHGVRGHEADNAFWIWPFSAPLLFENETSDARDHCANERTFLSYLKFSVYMAVVSVAIVLSFHLRHKASDIELRMAKPLGTVFWVLSVACLCLGIANYTRTINKYGRRAAIVQTGWKTQLIMAVIALVILGTSIALLVVNILDSEADS
ncbi:hypothetical protein QBC33DRAFT_539752 [Phialemonium atrogriseum]|uniref:DUF202 domain-containing protein n=1 Tax=Phialemonium atrogriseum TaxID=1093897 RepID=A0AAJ0BY69_9PEZI|nr:uncharacterized protein QBC33DRAFT_539752 [Phialemonium atrogriseum]KAK1766670.1 hypothetical protein QBC33DRAFT_539752 [Phialemonium atrogriseum]